MSNKDKRVQRILKKTQMFDSKYFMDIFNELVKKQASGLGGDSEYRSKLIKKVRDNYYTFRSSAEGKKWSWLKTPIYHQLFKYLHRQIHFNDYLRSILEIHENDLAKINKEQSKLEAKIDVIQNDMQIFSTSSFGNVKATEFEETYLPLLSEINNKLNAVAEIQKLQIMQFKSNNISSGSKIFFSQYGEDQWIVDNLKLPKHGYFIDVGAADGVTYSNSYYFEKNGWHGICFEPNPQNYAFAKLFRDNVKKIAISSKVGKQKFIVSNESADWSRLALNGQPKSNDSLITIETKSLDLIIKENNIKSVDLLSIDTEGTEIDVLDSLSFQKIQPKLIIVEYLNLNSEDNSKQIIRYFKRLPYELIHKTRANLVFQYEE